MRLLHYSDIENAHDDPATIAGLAGTIESLRDDRTLVCGTGDNVAPGVLPLVSEGEIALDFFEAVSPTVETFGNHDFDFGPDRTAEIVRRSPQRWLSANVRLNGSPFAGVDPISVGDLFAGAFLPGLLLVSLYLVWMIIKAIKDPESCPATPISAEERRSLGKEVLVALVPPLLLITAVLGSILGGIATPTEASSVGAVGAMILAASRWRLSLTVLKEAVISTATITSMIFIIIFGASVFSIVFRQMGGDNLVHEFLTNLPGGAIGAMIVVMLIMFVLGFILDTFEIIFIVIPITAPILLMLGLDPVWVGVMVGVNLQTSFLTPPFGFSLFYLRGVAPNHVSTGQIYKGAIPFVLIQIFAIALLFIFPEIVTWLPKALY